MRSTPDMAHRFVRMRLFPVRVSHSGMPLSRNERQSRLAASRRHCVTRCPWLPPPVQGPLIAVADALVKRMERCWHTWYFVLVRRPDDTTAVVVPTYHAQGTETQEGWRQAFAQLSPPVHTRIVALVSDGHAGLVNHAKRQGWVIQRCHFHLLARLQGRRSRWRTGRHVEEGKRIFSLTRTILTTPDAAALPSLINELEEIGWTSHSPEIRRVLSGFVNHVDDYRAWLRHPELRLPATNNTAETLIGLIEEVNRRARGFRTVAVLNEWITVATKTRATIRCAPAFHQQN